MLTSLIQIFAWFGLNFFKNLDTMMSQTTTKIVPFLPLQDGIGLFSSWSTFGKYVLSVLPYTILWIITGTKIKIAAKEGKVKYPTRGSLIVVKTIPWLMNLIIIIQIFLSIFGIIDNDSYGTIIKYFNLFALGTILAKERLDEKDLRPD